MHPSENGHMQERRKREKCQGSAGEESSKNILAIPHTRSSKKKPPIKETTLNYTDGRGSLKRGIL